MSRLSPEERRIQNEKFEIERKRAVEELRKTMPARLMKILALAQSLEVDAGIKLIESGVELRVRREEPTWIDATLTYDSEEWEVELVESDLNLIKSENEAKQARFNMAQDVWNNKLTPQERIALKEFIHNLR